MNTGNPVPPVVGGAGSARPETTTWEKISTTAEVVAVILAVAGFFVSIYFNNQQLKLTADMAKETKQSVELSKKAVQVSENQLRASERQAQADRTQSAAQFQETLHETRREFDQKLATCLVFQREGFITLQPTANSGWAILANRNGAIEQLDAPHLQNFGESGALGVRLFFSFEAKDTVHEQDVRLVNTDEYHPRDRNIGAGKDILIPWIPRLIEQDRRREIVRLRGYVTMVHQRVDFEEGSCADMQFTLETFYQDSPPKVRWVFDEWKRGGCVAVEETLEFPPPGDTSAPLEPQPTYAPPKTYRIERRNRRTTD